MEHSQSESEKLADLSVLVQREQAAAIVANTKVALPATCVIAILSGLLLSSRLPHAELIGWFVVTITITLLRLGISTFYTGTNATGRAPEKFLRLSTIGAFASGVAWSYLPILSAGHGSALDPTVIFIITGMTASAAIMGTAHRATVWAYMLPLTFVQFCVLIGRQTTDSYIEATTVFLYILLLSRASFAAERSFTSASRLKHEANVLAASLKVAHDAAGRAANRLDFLANHDSLTGLANRGAFGEAFDAALKRSKLTHSEVTLVLVDLDRFKAINDKFGHAVGDQVLISAARRMQAIVGEDQFVARLGGDEFAIILQTEEAEHIVQLLVNRLLESLARPIVTHDRQVAVSASIGYAVYPRDGSEVEELQISADIALYAAKSDGRGTARTFDQTLRATTDARRVLELDLASALIEGHLEVWFQPQINLGGEKVVGLEALIRWNHPNHGWVPPPGIVLAAAATGQSEALTTFVAASSCRMIRALAEVGRGDILISFNVSPDELSRYSLSDLIDRTLALHEVRPENLQIEITEEAMLSKERGDADLRAISAMGVRIAIDDFGVGYSSFGALKTVKFDCIKIDRVFVEGVASNADDRALVQAILGVSRALGVKAIAEGIETADQALVLASLGCNEVQGYYFARPMPAAKALEWVVERSVSLVPQTPRADLHALVDIGLGRTRRTF